MIVFKDLSIDEQMKKIQRGLSVERAKREAKEA
jgi:hypothetical protein